MWDPSAAHSGSPLDSGPWEARLMVIELPDLMALTADPDSEPDLDFPDPVVRDSALTTDFLRLHRVMDGPASTLERQSMLATWLQDAATRSPTWRQRTAHRRVTRKDIAVRRACEYLRDNPMTNVTLDQLADAAGTSKFQLVRLFRSAFGVPPHAFQVSQRVGAARRLLERGVNPSEVAVRVGFFDQSHLHRHFQPRLGMTPRQYADAFRRR